MSGICTVDIMAESHPIIPSLNMFAVGTAADGPPSSGHQWGKCRRITMLVLTQNLETSPRSHSSQKCAWTVSAHLALNTLTPPCITDPVSLTRRRVHTYIHPHTKPKGSPISSSPILLPLSIKGWWSAEKLKACSVFPNGICLFLVYQKSSGSLKKACPFLCATRGPWEWSVKTGQFIKKELNAVVSCWCSEPLT